MSPPFKPPAPPQPMHDPRMVAAYLHWKSRKEMERHNRSEPSSDANFSAHEGSYSIPRKGRWLKRILLVLMLLSLIVGALVILGNSGSKPVRPKPPTTLR